MEKMQLENWKLKEVADKIEIIASDSIEKRNQLLNELKIPLSNDLTGLNRAETNIDWKKMKNKYQFFFDKEGLEKTIENWLKNSRLKETEFLIITYGWKEPMIKIATDLFIKEWEDFFQSTKYETIIFSQNYDLIMEVSRDYHLYSNFQIKPT